MSLAEEIAKELNRPTAKDAIDASLQGARNNRTVKFEFNGVKIVVFKDTNGDCFITSITRPNAGKQAAEIHATRLIDTLKARYMFVLDDTKTRALAERDANMVLSPVSEKVFEDLVAIAGTGALNRKEISEAVKWAMTHMCTVHKAECVVKNTDITPVVWADDPIKPCWARLAVPKKELLQPPSAFAELMERCETPKQAQSMAQWIGSLMDETSGRDQYLFIKGPGNDGKSSLIAALLEVFGPRAAKPWSTTYFDNSHGTVALEGVRLIAMQEENSTGFVSSGKFKNLTGDDTILINPKGSAMRSIRLHCKFLISSNHDLKLRGTNADRRRAVIVNLRSYTGTDETFKPRMIAEAPAMLQYCWAQYQEWRQANPLGGLMGDQEAVDAVMAESVMATAEHALNKVFLFDPAAFTSVQDFNEALTRTVSDKTLHADIKQTARSHPAIEYKVVSRNGKKVRGYVGLRPLMGDAQNYVLNLQDN